MTPKQIQEHRTDFTEAWNELLAGKSISEVSNKDLIKALELHNFYIQKSLAILELMAESALNKH